MNCLGCPNVDDILVSSGENESTVTILEKLNNFTTITSLIFHISLEAPPQLSVRRLHERRVVECKVTKNWRPELQLCWRVDGMDACEVTFNTELLYQISLRIYITRNNSILTYIFTQEIGLFF